MSPEFAPDIEAVAIQASVARQPAVEIGPQTQELAVPEKDLVNKLNWIFSLAHQVTRRGSKTGGIERPLSTRQRRPHLPSWYN